MLLFSFGKHECTHMCNVLFSCFTWNTVRMAAGKVSKFVVGVSSSKLNLKRIHNNIITKWKKQNPKPLEQMLKMRFQSGLNGLYLQFRKVTWINGIKKRKLWGTIHVSGHEKHESTKKDRFTLQSQLDHFLHFVSHLQHPHHTHLHTHLYFYTCEDIQWSFPDPNN